jgi:hypothetical protein
MRSSLASPQMQARHLGQQYRRRPTPCKEAKPQRVLADDPCGKRPAPLRRRSLLRGTPGPPRLALCGAKSGKSCAFVSPRGPSTRVRGLDGLHHAQPLGHRVPRLPVRPPRACQETRIFLQGPFPAREQDEHLQIEELGKVGRIRARDDLLDDEDPALRRSGPVEGRENLATLHVIPVMEDALQQIGICRGDRVEHVSGHVGAAVAHAQLLRDDPSGRRCAAPRPRRRHSGGRSPHRCIGALPPPAQRRPAALR